MNFQLVHLLRLMMSRWWTMGVAEGSVNSIVQPYQDEPIADLQGDEIEEDDVDDEDGIRFTVLESRFENQETVSNW